MILLNQFLTFRLSLFHLILGRRGINNLGVQHFSGSVYHRKLTARAEGRIPAKNHFSRNGRLHELLQILSEHVNGSVLRLLRQVITNFPFNSRCYETVIAVLNHLFQYRGSELIFGKDGLLCQIL